MGAEQQILSALFCWGEQKAYKASYQWDGEVEENAESNPNSSSMLLTLAAQTRIHYSTVQEDILNICVNTGYVSTWSFVEYFKASRWSLTGVKYVKESRTVSKLCL